MNNFKLKYLIADTECLSDYFSLQCKNESNDKIFIYECYTDNDIKELYQLLSTSTRPQYYYSIDYDKVMLNALCKMVEKNYNNIIPKLREINDLIIQQKLNYFRLNRSFWCDYYFKYKKNDPRLKHQELFNRSANNFIGVERKFIDNFPDVLGQSKIIKDDLIINSIPKIMYYYSIRKDNSIIPTISLKNLQLVNEGYNVKFDFNKYTSIKEIKKDGLYDKWIEYSKNDISSLEKIFLGKPKEDIEKRYYAVMAVQKVKPDFLETDKMLYSENNTELITSILQLPKNQINHDFELDYTKLINTNYEKFNNFVSFVNDQKEIKKDYDIKTSYSNYYDTNFIDDDKQIVDEMGSVSTQINSFDIINIKNELNDIDMKIGFGGAHGAILEYIGENLLHYDYDGYYPSIILQYKHLFKNIIDIDLYEAIYHMRNDAKPELEKLENELIDLKKNIKDEKDLRNLLIGPKEKQIEKLFKIVIGEKLILNSAFGLINSNYNIPIAFKPLGRFICLKGQGEILNLIDKLKDKHKISNINTDGVICSKNPSKLIEIKRDGYFNVSIKNIDKLVQNDVNNYIGISGTRLKKKGMFNLSIKQWINKNEKLAPNIYNAIRLITDKKIKIKPIYFDRRYFDKSILDKPWYFTDEKRGNQIIKNLKKPEIISINDEIIYFTNNKDDADFEIYKKYAEVTRNKILKFTFHKSTNKNLPYFEEKLISDTDKNITEKRAMKRALGKLFGNKQIGFVGFQEKNKRNSYMNNEPIKPLIQYTMTDILKSTWCTGFLVENNKFNKDCPFLILDIDIYDKNTGAVKKGWQIVKPLLEELKQHLTFECWNTRTKKYNRKYIFLNPNKIEELHLLKEYRKYIEILDRATIYTINDLGDIEYNCNWVKPVNFPENIFNKFTL